MTTTFSAAIRPSVLLASWVVCTLWICHVQGDNTLETEWTRLDPYLATLTLMEASRSVLDCARACGKRNDCGVFCYQQQTYFTSRSACYMQTSSGGQEQLNDRSDLICFGATSVNAASPQVVDCPENNMGYELYETLCIKVYTTTLNYKDAGLRCAEDGGHLYHYKSLTEPIVTFLMERGYAPAANYFWVGADDLEEAEVYRWSDGSLLPPESDVWYNGEPNQIGVEDCVSLRVNRARLQNDDCPNIIPFICQIDV